MASITVSCGGLISSPQLFVGTRNFRLTTSTTLTTLTTLTTSITSFKDNFNSFDSLANPIAHPHPPLLISSPLLSSPLPSPCSLCSRHHSHVNLYTFTIKHLPCVDAFYPCETLPAPYCHSFQPLHPQVPALELDLHLDRPANPPSASPFCNVAILVLLDQTSLSHPTHLIMPAKSVVIQVLKNRTSPPHEP